MTWKVIHQLQAFSSAVRRTFVQLFTRFQLTVCSWGPLATAGLLSYGDKPKLLPWRNLGKIISWLQVVEFLLQVAGMSGVTKNLPDVEEALSKDQAGFRRGRSTSPGGCIDNIYWKWIPADSEDSHGVPWSDISVWHCLTHWLFVRALHLCGTLAGAISRNTVKGLPISRSHGWWRQLMVKAGKWSSTGITVVLSTVTIYTSDLPVTSYCSFIYAGDICCSLQVRTFYHIQCKTASGPHPAVWLLAMVSGSFVCTILVPHVSFPSSWMGSDWNMSSFWCTWVWHCCCLIYARSSSTKFVDSQLNDSEAVTMLFMVICKDSTLPMISPLSAWRERWWRHSRNVNELSSWGDAVFIYWSDFVKSMHLQALLLYH